MAQNRQVIFNLDNIVGIYCEELDDDIRYFAMDKWGDEYRIGEYNNTPEHENLIEKIAQCAGAINVFYMPEE